MCARRMEDTTTLEVFGQRNAQVSIVEGTEVLRLGRIGCTNLARIHGELGLTQTSLSNQLGF